jgi:hypothetical protein
VQRRRGGGGGGGGGRGLSRKPGRPRRRARRALGRGGADGAAGPCSCMRTCCCLPSLCWAGGAAPDHRQRAAARREAGQPSRQERGPEHGEPDVLQAGAQDQFLLQDDVMRGQGSRRGRRCARHAPQPASATPRRGRHAAQPRAGRTRQWPPSRRREARAASGRGPVAHGVAGRPSCTSGSAAAAPRLHGASGVQYEWERMTPLPRAPLSKHCLPSPPKQLYSLPIHAPHECIDRAACK